MTDKWQMTVLDKDQARMAGYAVWNPCEHLCIDVPDGVRTISVRMSNGKRVTFGFVPDRNPVGANPAGCLDIKYHDAPLTARVSSPAPEGINHFLGHSYGRFTFDTRFKTSAPPTLFATLLLDDLSYGYRGALRQVVGGAVDAQRSQSADVLSFPGEARDE